MRRFIMKSKWQKIKIGDYVSFQNGYAFKSKNFSDNGKYLVIRIKEIKDGIVKFFPDSARINIEDETNFYKYKVEKGDILFALTGDPVSRPNPLSWVGRISIYNHKNPALLNQRVCKAIFDKNINPLFFYYYFRLYENFFDLARRATGSANQANISTNTILSMPIYLPSYSIQEKISNILKSLDDKIELNNQINKNLEQQAQAIFKNITDSNIAEEPLYKFIKIKHGYAFKGNFIQTIDNGVVLVTPGNFKLGGGFQENKCKFFNGEYPNDYILNSGDLIVTMTDLSKDGDTLGYGALIPYDSQRIYLHNQRIGLVKIYDNRLSKDYIYWYLRSYDYHNKIVGSASGTTVKHTSPTRILEQNIPIPNKNCEYKIKSLSNIDFMISRNDVENIYLKQIRDLLIPKLMSGEIDVYNFT